MAGSLWFAVFLGFPKVFEFEAMVNDLEPPRPDQAGGAGDMDVAAKLLAIEELKRLKARYFYHLDKKDWTNWGEVFAEDIVMDVSSQFPDAPDPSVHVMEGRETVVKSVARFLGATVTVHHGHTPIIDLIADDAASAVWAMEDNLFMPDGSQMRGYGHYEEAYRKVDGAWRIARTKLTRLKLQFTPGPAEA